MKAAIPFQLLLQRFERLAHEFRDFSATQTGHVNVIAAQFPLVIVALALQMHQVEFVDTLFECH